MPINPTQPVPDIVKPGTQPPLPTFDTPRRSDPARDADPEPEEMDEDRDDKLKP
jgi:hypothetical protein